MTSVVVATCLSRIQEACDNITAVRDLFADNWLMQYHVAVYLCLLNRLDEARAALKACFELNPDHRLDALEDPDIEPLWTEIQRSGYQP